MFDIVFFASGVNIPSLADILDVISMSFAYYGLYL